MEIKILGPGEEDILLRAAPDVFDEAVDPQASRAFLADPRHHIAVAIDQESVVGFASAVHYFHPDKPTPELFINEVGVASTHQRRGIAKALMQAVCAHGRTLGCAQAWVLTDHQNLPANRLYAACQPCEVTPQQVMYSFALSPETPQDS